LKWGLSEIVGLIAIATLTSLPWVEIFGSGKSGTPCSRMHAEYATAWLLGEAELLELDEEPLEPDEELLEPDEELPDEAFELVLDPRCATPGLFAAPPQPAASTASAASPANSCIAFISSSPRAGWMLRAGLLYEISGYTTVSKAVTAL
jgi:hypothetical protein